uniref:inverse autotransporter beta domain-containing protein n=1 Tax=Morganella psychrotolerans TaxID=368603 RepID=UPI0039B08FF1
MINPSKNTAALLLLIQVCVPVSGSFLSIANASEINNKRWINSEENIKQLHHIQNNLPELGHDNSDKTENENEPFIAEKSSQLGSILSDENSSDAAKSYATGVASSAINQEINNWLNQVGHARVQLSTDKSGNADFLYPLLDQKTHMIFSQTGVRINTDRTIANIGLGYRQFSDNWMWGINSFYDYDITGSNKRMGIGTELGADYIKLSANGYIRLSNWRGSSLNDWSDFDERPANGFDVRLESYLPSHPQLGANLKYEQYFGEGINLNNGSSENDLNNDPKIYNIGLSYTPVPLVTIKANHAMGNINETSGTLEFNYHLGVPFNQQIDPGYVSTMRTLAASRYDFVDRNYDIVMQFKKQTLLTISLPDELLVQPKQRQSLKATITLSKYGVKDIQWSAPALIAAGGHFNQTSLNTIDVTLPAIHGNQQTYDVTAIATDNNGNQSNTATTRLVVTPMDGIISSFVVTPGTQVIANNTDSFDAVVTITDSAGNALENTAVEFSLSGFSPLSAFTLIGNNTSVHSPLTLSTNNRGLAVIKVKGKKVQKGLLIARLEDGTQASAPLHFVADSTTAQIDASDLAVIDNNALADSKSVNRVRVRVTDAAGNPLANETITVTADNGATIGSIVPTGPDGETSFTLTNNNAGDSSVTVTINGSTQKITVTFLPDSKTAHIDQANINIVKNNAIANGTDTS